MAVEALFVRLSSPGRSPEDGDIVTAETIHTDESTFKDGSPTGESAQKDATSGEPTWEEDASPLPIEESAHEDALPEEPTWEEDASPLPAEESTHEDALPEEPTWEEDASPLPAEESAPEDAPPLPEELPVDETAIVEDAHQDEHPFTGLYLSTAEALPSEGHLGAVQAHLVQVSTRDLALYKGWGKLTSDMKASRAQKLAVKGLPTPNEDGFVSIFVTGAGA
ncbi:hypothetical protein TSTA_080470 [Talaromyces stipitatus ATCC 10500]|uniref:Uncharacterized protein n=1 Tax=Talaromyces stipitatus (strain ATCC 10500 / CBS 375.48 / QM 6759 / NRRL 1006) TaxID=441959 RepID=B8MVJ9_TALSN|nr:uncharacterized protein TSTA_080470 [Talaromyces stipitatus ATCC 10500]EED11436.1 hypothetical protein TSTA_080470 [Talaromyces stipitatus ATCC 10500]